MKREAVASRKKASDTKDEYEGLDIEAQADSLKSEESEEAKKLYRRVASIIHPDMATDEESRNLRTRLMAELNEAYAKKDISKMREIFDQWQGSPEAISGEGTAADLVRTIRAIAQIKRRISEIEGEVLKIMESDIYVLMVRVHDADFAGRDILAEMSVSIDYEIQDVRNVLARLKK
jgi:DnaJ-class molecular chaperone